MTRLQATAVPMTRRIRRIGLALVAVVALALLVGAATEAVIRRRVSQEFPVVGRLVDIGGRRIQLDCRGSGSPTVVLEAGLNVLGSLSWASVHDSLAASTRVCAYSHVAGLVLVDASHPDQVARLQSVTGVGMLPATGPVSIGARVAATGVLRMLPPSEDPRTAPALMHRIADAHLPVSLAALASELRGLRTTFDDARAIRVLGDLPLVVLTAGAPTPRALLRQMGMTAAQGERMRTEWIAMQEERSTWSSNGRHVLVEDATHYVQFDRPDEVVRAVREVVGQAGNQTHSTKR